MSKPASFGLYCEGMIRGLLPKMGVPEEIRGASQSTFFRWATRFEDEKLGVDCWLIIRGVEIAVDFTVISVPSLVEETKQLAIGRGVVPIFFPQTLLGQAYSVTDDDVDGVAYVRAENALRELHAEFVAQLTARAQLLNGSRMTRAKAKEALKQRPPLRRKRRRRGARPRSASPK